MSEIGLIYGYILQADGSKVPIIQFPESIFTAMGLDSSRLPSKFDIDQGGQWVVQMRKAKPIRALLTLVFRIGSKAAQIPDVPFDLQNRADTEFLRTIVKNKHFVITIGRYRAIVTMPAISLDPVARAIGTAH